MGREAFWRILGMASRFVVSNHNIGLCQAEYCALVAGYAAKLVDLSPMGTYIIKIGVVVIFTIVNIIGLDWLERLETFLLYL